MKKYAQHFVRCALLCAVLVMNSPIVRCQIFDMKQTLSDGAQRGTIAFDGLAFLTGNFCACSFLPPGKVADYFGFQYVRDNDITGMGHTTDFLTVIANNLLSVLDSNQKEQIIALATAEVAEVNQYAYDRFPMIDAFVRLRDKKYPAGSPRLDLAMLQSYSAKLYRLDGEISIERAKLYGKIIRSLTLSQKNYLDSVFKLGMKYMPVLPEQIDKRPLNNNQFVGVMSIAGDIFTWYVGTLETDVYFCPERQGNYFGGFYIKDAPAMGNHGYSIDTSLTQHGGEMFLAALTPNQASLITEIVSKQKLALITLVEKRTNIAKLLRGYFTSDTIDTSAVLRLSEEYGALDAEISYYYATNFSNVGWSLTQAQIDTLHKLRNLDNYPCVGSYVYSDSIGMPSVGNTDAFFLSSTGTQEQDAENTTVTIYPNPTGSESIIEFSVQEKEHITLTIFNENGSVVSRLIDGTTTAPAGRYHVVWPGTDTTGRTLPSGMYWYMLKGEKSGEKSGEIVLVR